MNMSKYGHLPSQEEIQRFQELKSSQVETKLDSKWKSTIKEQIEDEMNRKVREALETPPHEKIIRFQEAAILKRKEKGSIKDLNAHLNFNERERNKYSKRLSTSITETYFHELHKKENKHEVENIQDSKITDLSNKFEYWLKPHYQNQQFSSSGVLLKLNNENSTFDGCEEHKTFRTGFDAMQNFGSLTPREKEVLFSTFTKNGFKEAMRTGRLPDGSKLEGLTHGFYRDKFGIIRDKHGPYWPKDRGPLHPTPHHKRILLGNDEPMLDPKSEKENAHEKSSLNNQFLGVWRHSQIVYDSELSPRNQKPPCRGDNICPDLVFESRFESGNLRQVRRTGQFEYELILQNDLYTNRHTQWFYFRIQNMTKNVTYKFTILNLLKPSSLYMNGMRMLMYSDKNANTSHCGWFRTGNHIRYSRNITKLQCPLLNREIAFYQLEFQIDFPYCDDVCYLAHCYPYTFSDLKNDLDIHLNNVNSNNIKITYTQEILCETRLGNSCFLLTITDPSIPDHEKLGAIITARVHPGETNASWMMNGLIQFLISDVEEAQQIRKKMLFKIVPMLNPDGVIVGNYRCSSAGRDLNRNYRIPREESFPTIYHTKKLVENLKEVCKDVAFYCDLHGHSRKQNVFMYGCDSQYQDCNDVNEIRPTLTIDTVETFINDRIFPWLMQKHRPCMFSFPDCQFKIRKCKESTGRVVMWKEFNIANSYTLETTFCGSDFQRTNRRHFNTTDLESIGKTLSEALLTYIAISNDEKLGKEVRLEVLKTILKQLIRTNKQMKGFLRLLTVNKSGHKDENFKENEVADYQSNTGLENEEENLLFDSLIDNMEIADLSKFGNLNIDISDIEASSSSSDSDSESQPEEIIENEEKQPKIKRKKKKLKLQNKDKSENSKKKQTLKRINSKTFPVIKTETNVKEKPINDKVNKLNFSLTPSLKRPSPLFISKFDGRSNGGIPCFAEERLEERARRKSFVSLKKDMESSIFKSHLEYEDDTFQLKTENKSIAFATSSEELMKQYRLLHKRSSDILGYRHYLSSYDNENIGDDDSKDRVTQNQIIHKPVISQHLVKEMTDNHIYHSVYQTGNSGVFKSITSDGDNLMCKQNTFSKFNPYK